MSQERGLFIVVEGLDKAGKTTQSARLVQNIQQMRRPVMHMSFPDRTTPTGELIDRYLKGIIELDDHAIHLLFSANRWEAMPKIRAVIHAGTNVVVDRYYWSGVTYTMAKQADNLDIYWARSCDIGLLKPDICFFLDISPEAARLRDGYGEERYEKQQFQATVRQNFFLLFQKEAFNSIYPVNAGKSLDQVEQIILEQFQQLLDNRGTGRAQDMSTVEALPHMQAESSV